MVAPENLQMCALEGREGIPISDLPHVIAQLYPALLKVAHRELEKRGESEQSAEDLVHGAVVRWLEASDHDVAYVFIRSAIRNASRNQVRLGSDAMTRHPLSLDARREVDRT